MNAFEDPNHPGNGPEYHSGLPCCYKVGCSNPAGTAWSPYFCFSCNVERLRRFGSALESLANGNLGG